MSTRGYCLRCQEYVELDTVAPREDVVRLVRLVPCPIRAGVHHWVSVGFGSVDPRPATETPLGRMMQAEIELARRSAPDDDEAVPEQSRFVPAFVPALVPDGSK